MTSLAKRDIPTKSKKPPKKKKRLRFSSLNKEGYDRQRIYIPVMPTEDEGKKEKPNDSDSDRGVVIIRRDGTSKKMDEGTISPD